MAQDLIARGRIGCVPGADFGANGEGYIRFCFARDRRELTGALESLSSLGIGHAGVVVTVGLIPWAAGTG